MKCSRLIPLTLVLLLLALSAGAQSPQQRIAELEAQLAKSKRFDFGVHNELRHLYNDIDPKRAMHHCDVIFKHSPMHGYILDILAGWEKDPGRAAANLKAAAERYPDFRYLRAACWLKAAQLSDDKALYRRVQKLGLPDYTGLAERGLAAERGRPSPAPWKVPVLEIRYFPLAGERLDLSVTSNVDLTLAEARAKCDRLTRETMEALEQGSRFRAYKNPKARASLDYQLVDTLEYLEAVPHDPNKPGYSDYRKILSRARLADYVKKHGVKEVWIWGYHSPQLAPWESNLSSPYGDISNSDRDAGDLPLLSSSYTVYHYNYQRQTSEAVHNHIHQIEALMRHYGGELWTRFEGKPGAWRCGNCHFPPNGRKDYDWANKEYVMSDIEDWRPEGYGKKQRLNCDRWGGDSLRWFVYWMQSMPGANNGLTYKGRPLTNWWIFMGDYDAAVANSIGLSL